MHNGEDMTMCPLPATDNPGSKYYKEIYYDNYDKYPEGSACPFCKKEHDWRAIIREAMEE